jgi:hypothetical protein
MRPIQTATVLTMATSLAATAYAADVMTIAANTGAQLGKATYCGFPTDEFAQRAGRAIDHYSANDQERRRAIEQFMIAATMAAQTGPVVESCFGFHQGYEESLQILRDAGF